MAIGGGTRARVEVPLVTVTNCCISRSIRSCCPRTPSVFTAAGVRAGAGGPTKDRAGAAGRVDVTAVAPGCVRAWITADGPQGALMSH